MDYKNGKIYSIRSYQTENIYIGSTIQKLSKRLSKHKTDYKSWKDGKHNYVTSFEILKYDDYYIELIEEYNCKSKMELEKREGEIIRQHNNTVNKIIVGRTKKEHYEDNKDTILLKQKEYREDNLEKFKLRYQEYRKNNLEKLKLRHQEYRKNNIESIKLQKQKYYNKNKDVLIFNSITKNKRNKKMNQLNMINKMWLDFQ